MRDPKFYICNVMHRRLKGAAHVLSYRIAYVLVDVDAMSLKRGPTRFLGVGRRGLLSVLARDHGDGESADLGSWMRAWLSSRGVTEKCARIELMTLPRMWGFVFNPISIFFIYDENGALHHIVYEVNNTFGGRKFYLASADKTKKRQRHQNGKSFHVSPFFDVDGGYEFSLKPPQQRFLLTIDYKDSQGETALKARLAGYCKEASASETLKVFFGFPMMTFGVIAAIHWEAIKMLAKGHRLRPAPPTALIRGDKGATGHNDMYSTRSAMGDAS